MSGPLPVSSNSLASDPAGDPPTCVALAPARLGVPALRSSGRTAPPRDIRTRWFVWLARRCTGRRK